MIIKQSEAERLLDFATFICLRNDGEMRELSMEEAVEKAEDFAFICLRNDGKMRELSIEEAVEKAEDFARNEMIAFCEAEGIEGVDED